MIARVEDTGAGWAPELVSPLDPLYSVDGFSLALELQTDHAGHLAIALLGPDVRQTAFGLLADLVTVSRSRADGGRAWLK
jgi:homoserine dehydrogenase